AERCVLEACQALPLVTRQLHGLADDLVDVDQLLFLLVAAPAGELLDAADTLGGVESAGAGRFKGASARSGQAPSHQGQFAEAEHAAQGVVEVVGHAAS